MTTLIIGYGYIGKYLSNELQRIQPDIYDKYLKVDTRQHEQYDIAWLCLPTPYDTCDIDELVHAMKEQEAAIYVIKSTILPHRIEELQKLTGKQVVICPEFYGKSKDSVDFKQDYTILGGDRDDCDKVINSIKFCYNGNHRFIKTSQILASLVKYMSNSFLLMKQTFCNEFYQITKGYDVSYNELRELFILDKRFTGVRTNADDSTLHLDHHCHSKDVPAIANVTNSRLLKFICSYHHISKKERKPKTFYIGLVGSGKTTLYRKLNENKELNAVEIELPQSCINDEVIKEQLFNIYYHNDNIDVIIAHPYYLPKDFWQRISKDDKIIYLDIPLDERLERIKKRSKEIETNPDTLFSTEFIKQEEEYYINFKNKVSI